MNFLVNFHGQSNPYDFETLKHLNNIDGVESYLENLQKNNIPVTIEINNQILVQLSDDLDIVIAVCILVDSI